MLTPAAVGLEDNDSRSGATALDYARRIVSVVAERGMPQRAADIAIATALTETNLTLYANLNNPASLLIPHDAVGYDHGSVGLFQQQVGGAAYSTANWGTTAELMDVETSAGKFLDRLAAWVDAQGGWGPQFGNGEACQGVQGSAFPDRYAARDDEAIRIVAALWPAPAQQRPPTPVGTAGEDDDDMTFIAVSADPGHPQLLVQGGRALPLSAQSSAAALVAAGVKSIVLDTGDYLRLAGAWK